MACDDGSAITSPAPLLERADSIDSLMCPDNECLDRLLQSPASSNTVMTDDHATSSGYTSSAAVQLSPLPGGSLRGSGAVNQLDVLTGSSAANQPDIQDIGRKAVSPIQEAMQSESSQAAGAALQEFWEAHMADMDELLSPIVNTESLWMSSNTNFSSAAGDLAQQDAAATAALDLSSDGLPMLVICTQLQAGQQSQPAAHAGASPS